MTKSVLVLGGSGFLGLRILLALQRAGVANLACVDRTQCTVAGVRTIATNVLDTQNILDAITGYETVINCIGQITAPIQTCLQLNSVGMTNIANAVAHSGARVLHISTVAVYGTIERANEDTPLNPETPYATCKAYAEFILQQHLDPHTLTIFRLSNLFGENQTKGILAYLQKAYRSPETLSFNNNGDLRRYYLHVDDCASGIVQAVLQENIFGTLNFIGKEQYTIKELLGLLAQTTGKEFAVRYENQPPLENVQHIDDSRIHQYLPITYTKSIRKLFEDLQQS